MASEKMIAVEKEERLFALTPNCRNCYYLGTGYGGCKLAWEQRLRPSCPYYEKTKGANDNAERPAD